MQTDLPGLRLRHDPVNDILQQGIKSEFGMIGGNNARIKFGQIQQAVELLVQQTAGLINLVDQFTGAFITTHVPQAAKKQRHGMQGLPQVMAGGSHETILLFVGLAGNIQRLFNDQLVFFQFDILLAVLVSDTDGFSEHVSVTATELHQQNHDRQHGHTDFDVSRTAEYRQENDTLPQVCEQQQRKPAIVNG